MSKFANVYTVKGRSQTLYRSCCMVDKEQEEVSQRAEILLEEILCAKWEVFVVMGFCASGAKQARILVKGCRRSAEQNKENSVSFLVKVT